MDLYRAHLARLARLAILAGVRRQPHGAAPCRDLADVVGLVGRQQVVDEVPDGGEVLAGALVGGYSLAKSAGSAAATASVTRSCCFFSSVRRASREGYFDASPLGTPPVLPASSHSAGKVDSRPRATPVWFDAEARWHRVQAGWFTTPCGCCTICSSLRSLTSDSR